MSLKSVIKRTAKKLFTKFMNIGLTSKVVVIYFIAVLFPTSVLACVFYQTNLKGLEEIYYENQRNVLLSAKENLTTQLNQITAAYNYYQQSDTLMELLLGSYADTANTLFYYIRDINPLIKATKVNSYIQSVSIYGYQEYSLNMENGLASVNYMNRDEAFIKEIKGHNGIWEISFDGNTPSLHYYRNIYASVYPYDIGILKFTVDLKALSSSFYRQVSRPFFFTNMEGSLIGYENGYFTKYESSPELLTDKKNNIYTLSFSEKFPSIIVPIQPMDNIKQQSGLILFTLIIMVIVFTIFYIMVTSSIISRLKVFSAHMRQTDAEELTPFENNGYLDEVGSVISSYNGLVERTNNLIHENLKAQIQKRESDYYALQAQIQPHFLYNILENIRMSAEVNHDTVTADMLMALGKHMRYNLNMSSQPILLVDELYFARNYLQIHKIRMKEKVRFEILISSEIDDVYCPRFLMQPILENALQHGYRLDHQLFIQILVTDAEQGQHSGEIKILIQDNGNGIPEESLRIMQDKLCKREVEEASHVGLLNVNGRLSSFCKSGKGCIFIESKEGMGTQIIFYLKRGNKSEDIDSRG